MSPPGLYRHITRWLNAILEPFVTRARLLVIDEDTRSFITHNKRIWKAWKVQHPESTILVDYHGISQNHIAYSYSLNILAKNHRAAIKTFSGVNAKFPKNLYSRKRTLTYRSFNAVGHVHVTLPRSAQEEHKRLSEVALSSMETKEDLFELSVRGIWVGIDIYESYLRKCQEPTVNLSDPRLKSLVGEAVTQVLFWEDFFAANKVAAVIVSHDSYIDLDILCKVAYRNSVPVYLPWLLGITYATEAFSTFEKMQHYKSLFTQIRPALRKQALQIGGRKLASRIAGKLEQDQTYLTKSAFNNVDTARALPESDRLKVLVASHCFYDNPHAYGGLLFHDFYEWMMFLGEMSNQTDYDWYVKLHRDPLAGTEEVVSQILSAFPQMTLVSPEISFHQLAREGIQVALTAHGSIGHELPALGIQVVNAGLNPHVSFDFNWHPCNLDEYRRILLNLHTLSKEISQEELAAFYYMNYHYFRPDDLFLDAYDNFLNAVPPEQRGGPAAYAYHLRTWSSTRHDKTIQMLTQFFESGCRELSRVGPVIHVGDKPSPKPVNAGASRRIL